METACLPAHGRYEMYAGLFIAALLAIIRTLICKHYGEVSDSLYIYLSFLSKEFIVDSNALCVKNSYSQPQLRLSYFQVQCDLFWTTDLTSFKILNCASNSCIQ